MEQKSIKFDLTASAPDGRSLETREAKSERVNDLVNPKCKCTRRRPKISSLLTANVESEGCHLLEEVESISLYSSVFALPKVMFSSAFHFYCFRFLPLPSPASAYLHRSACLRAFVAFTCCRSERRVVNLTRTSVSCALSLALRQAHFRDFGSSDAKLIMKATLRCQKNQFVIACFCFRIKKLLEKTFLSFFSASHEHFIGNGNAGGRRWSGRG